MLTAFAYEFWGLTYSRIYVELLTAIQFGSAFFFVGLDTRCTYSRIVLLGYSI